MQTGDQLWALWMILSCPTEDILVGWDYEHNPRPLRPVQLSPAAAHYPPSQAKEITGFLSSV